MGKIKLMVATVLLGAALFAAGWLAGYARTEKTQREYYRNTEALLDSLYNWDSSFEEEAMNTDAYYNYEAARDKVN